MPVFGAALPADSGDPGLNTWLLWWNAHAVPFTERWWNAPMFFPLRGALAMSETFLALSPLTTPLIRAGASSVVAYNVAYLVSFPAAALAAHALAHRLTGRHDAAFIAGLAFGFSPYRLARMAHLQMLWSCWMPLALFFLHRFVGEHRRRDLVLFGLCWLLNGLTCGYYLTFFPILVGLWVLWFARAWRDWLAVGATLVVASLPLAPILFDYVSYQTRLELSRSVVEIEHFSADLTAIWAASRRAWLPAHRTIEPEPEAELYPGLAVLGLVIAGAVTAWRGSSGGRARRLQLLCVVLGAVSAAAAATSLALGGLKVGRLLSIEEPYEAITISLVMVAAALALDRRAVGAWRGRSPLVFYVASAAILLAFALGPLPQAFSVRLLAFAPYQWLMDLPGGRSLRVPARFAMLFILCLAQAAALAFRRLTPRGASVGAAAALGVVIFLEGWSPRMELATVPPAIDLSKLDADAVVLELPIIDVISETSALLRATVHGRPLVNGYSGYGPPHYHALEAGLAAFDPSVISALQRFAPLIVFVDRARDPRGRYRDFIQRLPDAKPVGATRFGSLYTLPSRPEPAPTGSDPPLVIASAEASAHPELASAMTDGSIETGWDTGGPQTPGDRVAATLERPAVVSRIEIDLGRLRDHYPRKLQVRVGEPGAAGEIAWEGGTAGLAMVGALTDPARSPLTIDLPAGTTGRQIELTLTAEDRFVPWSIAELRVFGR